MLTERQWVFISRKEVEGAIWTKPDSRKGELGQMRGTRGEKPGNGRCGAMMGKTLTLN